MFLRFINGTAKNSGQRLDHVNGTHLVLALVLASGKLELQKKFAKIILFVQKLKAPLILFFGFISKRLGQINSSLMLFLECVTRSNVSMRTVHTQQPAEHFRRCRR